MYCSSRHSGWSNSKRALLRVGGVPSSSKQGYNRVTVLVRFTNVQSTLFAASQCFEFEFPDCLASLPAPPPLAPTPRSLLPREIRSPPTPETPTAVPLVLVR